jgi:hypothetical protein
MPRSSTGLPAFIAPQTPILSAQPPSGTGWIHEIKHDGFRTMLRIDGKHVRAFTRNGNDARIVLAIAARPSNVVLLFAGSAQRAAQLKSASKVTSNVRAFESQHLAEGVRMRISRLMPESNCSRAKPGTYPPRPHHTRLS